MVLDRAAPVIVRMLSGPHDVVVGNMIIQHLLVELPVDLEKIVFRPAVDHDSQLSRLQGRAFVEATSRFASVNGTTRYS